MLQFCLDDSGDRKDPIDTLAGYVAPAHDWVRFETRARSLLEMHKIEYLTGKELHHRRGQFKGWNSSETREFLRQIFELLGDCAIAGFECSVIRRHFEEAKERENAIHEQSAYAFSFKVILNRALKYYGLENTLRTHGAKADFIIESGRATNAGLQSWYNEVQPSEADVLGSLKFMDKKELIGLQVADILAFYSRRIRCQSAHAKKQADAELLYEVTRPVAIHDQFLATDFHKV